MGQRYPELLGKKEETSELIKRGKKKQGIKKIRKIRTIKKE